MTLYEDETIRLGPSGITIKHYHRPRRERHIPYGDIKGAEIISLRFGTGRYRLVGFSPGRPRHFFHWDGRRPGKRQGVSLDLGRWRRIGLTPDEPGVVLDLVLGRTGGRA